MVSKPYFYCFFFKFRCFHDQLSMTIFGFVAQFKESLKCI